MKCCLCDGEVEVQSNGWCHGHNAEPLVKNGRCCETCNSSKVIPARLVDYFENRKELDSAAKKTIFTGLILETETTLGEAISSALRDEQNRNNSSRNNS